MKIRFKNLRPISKCCAMIAVILLFTQNINAQILSEDYAAGADVVILKNEINIFSSIQEGVRLSVIECELFESCSASVNRDELSQLITTIDGRINTLSLRYSDTDEADLEEVLIGYVDVRDGYNEILEKLETLPQFAQQQSTDEFSFDDFFTFEGNSDTSVPSEMQELFEDADEELVDDE